MMDVLLGTSTFLLGACSGALLSHSRDRHLLHLYGELVGDMARIIRGRLVGPAVAESRTLADEPDSHGGGDLTRTT